MWEHGQITKYRHNGDGIDVVIHLPNKNIVDSITRKQVSNCSIQYDDGRHISAEQRKKAYATIADIAVYTGYMPEELKEILKYIHMACHGCDYFSLSDCSMDTAREFINTVLDIALEYGVPLSDFGSNRTDDISRYLYQCIRNGKCAVCGDYGEIHHWDAIGMGNDRESIDDSGHRKICLCRKHHTECHKIGNLAFEERYKVYGIVYTE